MESSEEMKAAYIDDRYSHTAKVKWCRKLRQGTEFKTDLARVGPTHISASDENVR